MTALIIICIILVILLFLFTRKVNIYVSIHNTDFEYKIKYLFFTLLPRRKKNKKVDKKKEISESNNSGSDTLKDSLKETTDNTKTVMSDEDADILSMSDKELLNPDNAQEDNQETKDSKLDSLIEKIDKIKAIIESSKKGISKIFKNIRIDDIEINFIVGAEEPDKQAIKYGAVSAATYNIISLMRCYFNLSVRYVDINCPFGKNESTYNVDFRVNSTLSVLVAAALSVAYNLFKNRDRIIKSKKTEVEPLKS